MHDDFQPYWMPTGRYSATTTNYAQHPEQWMVPMQHDEKTSIVEIATNWTLDDWPPFQWDGSKPNAVSIVYHCLLFFRPAITIFALLIPPPRLSSPLLSCPPLFRSISIPPPSPFLS